MTLGMLQVVFSKNKSRKIWASCRQCPCHHSEVLCQDIFLFIRSPSCGCSLPISPDTFPRTQILQDLYSRFKQSCQVTKSLLGAVAASSSSFVRIRRSCSHNLLLDYSLVNTRPEPPSTTHHLFELNSMTASTSSSSSSSSSNVTVTSQSGAEIEVPSELLCPITHQIMVNPMISRGGHNFERSAILSWLAQSDKCPLTRSPMSPSDLISNRSLKAIIKGWRIQHDVPEPTPEELKEVKCGIVTFLHVSPAKHGELVSRSSEYQTAEAVARAAARRHRRRQQQRRSSSHNHDNREEAPLGTEATAPEAPAPRGSGEGRLRFVSRILAAAGRE